MPHTVQTRRIEIAALIAPCDNGGNARIVPFFAVVYVFNRKAYFRNFHRKIYLRKMHKIFKPIFKFERIAFIERSDDGGFNTVIRFVKVALFQIDVTVQNDDIIFRFGKFDRKRFSDTGRIVFLSRYPRIAEKKIS